MVDINDGGQAFPSQPKWWDPDFMAYKDGDHQPGMTLRDYLAAKAMQSLISRVPFNEPHGINQNAISVAAYLWADAMLKARSA